MKEPSHWNSPVDLPYYPWTEWFSSSSFSPPFIPCLQLLIPGCGAVALVQWLSPPHREIRGFLNLSHLLGSANIELNSRLSVLRILRSQARLDQHNSQAMGNPDLVLGPCCIYRFSRAPAAFLSQRVRAPIRKVSLPIRHVWSRQALQAQHISWILW